MSGNKTAREDEPPPVGGDEKFKWRGNPEQTFSDWTIQIVTNKEVDKEEKKRVATGEPKGHLTAETVTINHVHKCILAYGTRKSEYFFKLFLSANAGNFNEADSRASRIELEPLAANAFPALLDYVYAPERGLDINTNTAVALHFLGDYFQMQHLRWDVRRFVLKDMSLKNIDTYYDHAVIFRDEAVLEMLAHYMDRNLLSIDPSSSIVKRAEPTLWVKTLEISDKETLVASNLSLHWSKLVSKIGTLKSEGMDRTTFDKLTDATKMPKVHKDAALVLCALDDGLKETNGEPPQKDNELTPASLQERCAAALAATWEELSPSEDGARLLEGRTPAFLASLWMESMRNAKSALTASRNEVSRFRHCAEETSRRVSSISRRLNDTNELLSDSQEELHKTKAVLAKLKPLPTTTCQRGGSQKIPHALAGINPHFNMRTTVAHFHVYVNNDRTYFPALYFDDGT